jgi:hypothetical protein
MRKEWSGLDLWKSRRAGSTNRGIHASGDQAKYEVCVFRNNGRAAPSLTAGTTPSVVISELLLPYTSKCAFPVTTYVARMSFGIHTRRSRISNWREHSNILKEGVRTAHPCMLLRLRRGSRHADHIIGRDILGIAGAQSNQPDD